MTPADGDTRGSAKAEGTAASSQDELIALALAARGKAYAPYSHFHVGAAVRTGDGRTFTGANVENASYGLSVCAERSAILAAVLAGARDIVGLAVVTQVTPPAAPCGMCRQTLAEFARDSAAVSLINEQGERFDATLGELFPRAFRPSDLLE